MDRLCLNVQCSLITTTIWPTPCFYYIFDDKIFVTVDKKASIFTKHIWQPISYNDFKHENKQQSICYCLIDSSRIEKY